MFVEMDGAGEAKDCAFKATAEPMEKTRRPVTASKLNDPFMHHKLAYQGRLSTRPAIDPTLGTTSGVAFQGPRGY